MERFLEPDQLALRERVRAWVKRQIPSGGAPEGDVDAEARSLAAQLGRDGLAAYAVPEAYGGVRAKVQARDLCVLREELAFGSALADATFALQALGSYPITMAGDDAQKARFLPPIGKGEVMAAFALTEPGAGSDVSSLETRAVKRGGEYCITGRKRFISNAGLAGTYVVFASTEPEKKGKGISAFIVEGDRPGLMLKEKTRLISPHPIGAIAFEECIVPEANLIGRQGDGFSIALGTLDMLRCTVGAAAAGLARRALVEALHYSRERRQFGREIGEFQGIQFKLADMATELEASELLVYQAAWLHDAGEQHLKHKSSMAKLFATEAAQRIVDQALQIHGGMGVVEGTVVERLYRDVRSLRIYEGTSEIQKLIIARSLLKP
jgi:acyl-CoA dehydrogenase